MAFRSIRCMPDPILRQKAKRVRFIDHSVQRLIDDMIETMQSASGVGLAAPQVGVLARVIVIQIPDEDPFALVNPVIVQRFGERVVTEGCLSIPGYQGKLVRSNLVSVKAKDRAGRSIRIKASELLAQALEHEIDHLDGVLYVDRIVNEEDFYPLTSAKESIEEDGFTIAKAI